MLTHRSKTSQFSPRTTPAHNISRSSCLTSPRPRRHALRTRLSSNSSRSSSNSALAWNRTRSSHLRRFHTRPIDHVIINPVTTPQACSQEPIEQQHCMCADRWQAASHERSPHCICLLLLPSAMGTRSLLRWHLRSASTLHVTHPTR